LRYLLMDTLMWSGFIEIRNVSTQDTMHLLLMEDQQMIQALSADTPQKAFTNCIGSWCVVGCLEDTIPLVV
jgi:hypothetical protein